MDLLEFRESKECSKCGSCNLEIKLQDSYRNGIPGNSFAELKYAKDAEEYLRIKCNNCGRIYCTKTKDAR